MGKKVKQHVEGKSKADRKATRAKLGTLKHLTVQPKTKERYTKAVNQFYQYLRDHDILLPRQRIHLDPIVSEYLEFLWSEGEGRRSFAHSRALAVSQNCSRLYQQWVSHPCRV